MAKAETEVSVSEETLSSAHTHRKLEETGKDPALEPPEEAWPC